MTDRRKALQIASDGQRVIVRHFVKPLVRHHRREEASILSLTVANRANNFCLTPASDSGLGIRREVRSAGDSDTPVAEFRTAAERPVDVMLRVGSVTTSAYRDVAHDVLAARRGRGANGRWRE